MAVLKIRDENGNVIEVAALKGEPGSVVQTTDSGGEIFNDYENNIADAEYAHAQGTNTIAGIKGYKILSIGGKTTLEDGTYRYLIFLDDYQLEIVNNRYFTKGNVVNIDAKGQHYGTVTIDTVTYGTTAGVDVQTTAIYVISPDSIEFKANGSSLDNWLWTIDKSNGVPLGRSVGANAKGVKTKAIGYGASAEGRHTKAYGNHSHAEGYVSQANGHHSHVEGYNCQTFGECTHAEGVVTKASKYGAHSEGGYTESNGQYSHAEGYKTIAQANNSHSEGSNTLASGSSAHAEGSGTIASGTHSHAGGTGTIASGESQYVVGKYNKENKDSIFIVGNGQSDTARSNAFEVKKDGSLVIVGIAITPAQLQALLNLVSQ